MELEDLYGENMSIQHDYELMMYRFGIFKLGTRCKGCNQPHTVTTIHGRCDECGWQKFPSAVLTARRRLREQRRCEVILPQGRGLTSPKGMTARRQKRG